MMDRDSYVQRLKSKLDEWNAEIELIEAKAARLKTQKKLEYQEEIAALTRKRDEMQERLEEVSNGSEEAWLDLRQACDQAWDNLKQGLARARKRFD